ncbi:protein HIRA isoform 4-T4 [Lycaon pictus]
MKLLKPTWVNHNGKPIFSVDIHPDGTKFATGGQGQDSGKVVIWNMSPVLQEDDEKDENIPKMLCQMDNHLACVNCVRWSNSGMYLASGGDDKLIMVWKRATYIGPSTVFGSSGKLANVEQWRCVSILRSHSGDVMDVAWSPHDAWLASCSVDNTVVIWNAVKFPEILATLRGHSGLVKGLTWDPVGKYIASQADDRSLKVWRTLDWQLETSITKPFDECGGTTHVLRLSWSPDGHYLVSAHAMNNSGPTAQIIEREGWKTNMDFVGHRKAVTVVKFNPKIFKKKQKNGSSAKPSCPYCCCAVGSKDRSLSVWLTCLKRPLVVIHELFDKSIMDISWTLNGLGILVCSMDGSVAFLDFSQDELGDPLSEEEKSRIHQSTYGKSLAIMTEAQLSTAVIENPEMLKYQRRQQQQQLDQKSASSRETSSAASVAGVVNGESLEDIRKNLLKKQVETRTADGRRRITPLCIAQLDTGDFSTAFFNSIPLSGSLAGTMLSSHSNPQLLPLDSSTPNSFGASKPSTEPVATTGARPAGDTVSKDSVNATSTPAASSPSVLTTPSKIEPMKAFDSRFTERSKATPGAPALTSVTPTAMESDVVCVACEKRMLSVFSACGRRLLPPILLPSPISTLHCTGSYVMALTAAATLSVWDVHRQVVVVKEESLHSILAGSDMTVSQILLTQHGIPVMNLSDGKAYCFNPSLSTWNLVSDKQDSLAQCADFRSSLPPQDAMLCSGPLAIVQGRASTSGRQAARLFSVPHVVQQETTLAYLENQVAAALTLQSSHEYRHWLLLYARYLVNEGSAEEGATEGAAASHWAESPLSAPLYRVSRTARHPEGQVACPGLPWLQQGQGHTLATNNVQGPLSPRQATEGRGDTGRRWVVLCQRWPSNLGRLPLCPGPLAPSERGSSASHSSLPPGSPYGAGAGALPCCPGVTEALPGLPSPARSRGGH